MSHLNIFDFGIFHQLLSGNTVRLQALGFQKLSEKYANKSKKKNADEYPKNPEIYKGKSEMQALGFQKIVKWAILALLSYQN